MRYLSVCSGIEAASVAWHHLGWEPVGFSEIEPFPAAVLKHRFPHVPNYGDMTKFEEWPIEPGTVDLLVGGTPCQSFSVAGLRKGLEDPRGNLMLTYLAIAARFQPRWVVWENVPGVLSSNGGRDFGTFIAALGQLGYGVAYRVLDAQYVRVGRWPRAVPQRRRRVFVVGCLGDWAAAAEVLALREGVQRHLEAGGTARKGAPSDAEGGARGGCPIVSPCIKARDYKGPSSDGDGDGAPLIAGYRWQNDEIGLVDDGTISGLRASAGTPGFHEMNHPVVVQSDTHAIAVDLQNVRAGGDVAGTLDTTRPSRGGGQAVAIGTDCYNGAVTGDVAATMGTPGSSVNASGPTVMTGAVAFPWQSALDPIGKPDVVSGTLIKNQTMGVAHSLRAEGFDASEDGTGRGTPLVPVAPSLTAANDPSRSPQSAEVTQQVAAVHASTMTVRRLSPRECERLQAFPDSWTMIPWRGKPAEQCPDGPRYKALGNSMACNCMAWIGERIQAWAVANAT